VILSSGRWVAPLGTVGLGIGVALTAKLLRLPMTTNPTPTVADLYCGLALGALLSVLRPATGRRWHPALAVTLGSAATLTAIAAGANIAPSLLVASSRLALFLLGALAGLTLRRDAPTQQGRPSQERALRLLGFTTGGLLLATSTAATVGLALTIAGLALGSRELGFLDYGSAVYLRDITVTTSDLWLSSRLIGRGARWPFAVLAGCIATRYLAVALNSISLSLLSSVCACGVVVLALYPRPITEPSCAPVTS